MTPDTQLIWPHFRGGQVARLFYYKKLSVWKWSGVPAISGLATIKVKKTKYPGISGGIVMAPE